MPDTHLLFVDMPWAQPGDPVPADAYSILFSVLSPHSRGTVRLASSEPPSHRSSTLPCCPTIVMSQAWHAR